MSFPVQCDEKKCKTETIKKKSQPLGCLANILVMCGVTSASEHLAAIFFFHIWLKGQVNYKN